MRLSIILAVTLYLCSAFVPRISNAEDGQLVGELRVQPSSIILNHRRHPHSILVTGETADGRLVDLTSQASFKTSNEKIASVNTLGLVQAKGTGNTEIVISAGGKSIKVKVAVQLPKDARKFSFRHDVMPVLSKAGCNAGAGHGYSLGKNGFKLSLRGSDPAKDYQWMTEEFFERRINRHNPPTHIGNLSMRQHSQWDKRSRQPEFLAGDPSTIAGGNAIGFSRSSHECARTVLWSARRIHRETTAGRQHQKRVSRVVWQAAPNGSL